MYLGYLVEWLSSTLSAVGRWFGDLAHRVTHDPWRPLKKSAGWLRGSSARTKLAQLGGDWFATLEYRVSDH